uniref:flagellin n=1 Tax=Waltera intestinalis TaxID=2606635 RepID=UPI003FF108DB
EITTIAVSLIRDSDMATEMVKFSNINILAQACQAMLAQSNQANQGVLSLLQ